MWSVRYYTFNTETAPDHHSAYTVLTANANIIFDFVDMSFKMATEIMRNPATHYNDVITSAIVSRITSLTIVYSTVYSGADQRKHQSSALLAFVRGIHLWPVKSPHKWPVTQTMFPTDDVIMPQHSRSWFYSRHICRESEDHHKPEATIMIINDDCWQSHIPSKHITSMGK